MENIESQVSEIQPLQNISTSWTGMKGMIIGLLSFLLYLYIIISSRGGGGLFWLIIPSLFEIFGIIYGIKGLREKPTSNFSIIAIVLGVLELAPIIALGMFALYWRGG